jgi:hypothetical protein
VVNAAQPSVTAFRLRLAAAAYPLASGTSSTHCNAGQGACTVGAGCSSLGGHRRIAADRKQRCSALGQTFVCSPKQMGERPICHRPVVGTAQPPTATLGAVYSPGGSGQHPHSPGLRFNSRRSVRRRSIASATLLSSCHAVRPVMPSQPPRNEPAMKSVWPNPSVEPTASGLRPPAAAYLKRWAARNTVRAMLRPSQFPPVCTAVAAHTSLCALARPIRFTKSASQPSEWAVRPSAASAPVSVHHRHRLWLFIRMRVVAPLLAVSNCGVHSLHSLARQP